MRPADPSHPCAIAAALGRRNATRSYLRGPAEEISRAYQVANLRARAAADQAAIFAVGGLLTDPRGRGMAIYLGHDNRRWRRYASVDNVSGKG